MKSSFSIIIPVLHESLIINRTIEHIRRIGSGFEFEIIVVDGDKEGGTINFIKHNDVVKIVSPGGRGIQMNKGASAAKGDVLLFLHTDTELPEEAFDGISSVISNREYTGGAFDLGIEIYDYWKVSFGERLQHVKHKISVECKHKIPAKVLGKAGFHASFFRKLNKDQYAAIHHI